MLYPESAFPPRFFFEVKVNELDLMSIIHLELERLPASTAIYGGDCPLCKAHRSFFVWLDRRRIYRCFECGIRGKIKE